MKTITPKEEVEKLFTELQSFASKLKTKKVAKADMPISSDCCCDDEDDDEDYLTSDDLDYVNMRIDNLRQMFWDLYSSLSDHMNNGHLPKIIGADKMNTALKVLKLDGDYVAEPRTVYASTGKPESVVVTFTVKENA